MGGANLGFQAGGGGGGTGNLSGTLTANKMPIASGVHTLVDGPIVSDAGDGLRLNGIVGAANEFAINQASGMSFYLRGPIGSQDMETGRSLLINGTMQCGLAVYVKTKFAWSALAISAGLVAVDNSLSDGFTLAVTANCTLSNPTNPASGEKFLLRTKQSAAFTLAYGTKYRFPGGVAPVITATAGATDYLAFLYHEVDDKWDYVGSSFNF